MITTTASAAVCGTPRCGWAGFSSFVDIEPAALPALIDILVAGAVVGVPSDGTCPRCDGVVRRAAYEFQVCDAVEQHLARESGRRVRVVSDHAHAGVKVAVEYGRRQMHGLNIDGHEMAYNPIKAMEWALDAIAELPPALVKVRRYRLDPEPSFIAAVDRMVAIEEVWIPRSDLRPSEREER